MATDPEERTFDHVPRLWFKVTEEDYILHDGEHINYLETDQPLSDEHQGLFNDLCKYVQDLLTRTEPWTYAPSEDSEDEITVPDEFIEYLRLYAHKKSICRHLKGSDYDMERSKQSFKTVVQWRIKNNVDNLTYEDYRDVLDCSLIFCTFHRDKLGHPIAYFRFPNEGVQSEEWERVQRSAIFAAEKGAELSGEKDLFQTTWILDFENLGFRTAPPLQVIRDMIHLWTAFYPERLHRAYIANAPVAFRAVWAIAGRFLTDNTKGKITMLDSTASKNAESFGDLIESDCLHADYGGTWDEEYSFEYEAEGRIRRLNLEHRASLDPSDLEEVEPEEMREDE